MKENEELKGRKQNIEPVLIGNKMYFIDKGLYEDLLNDIKNNYISIQKVKDKIEEIQKDKNNKYYDMFLEARDIEYMIEALDELLEKGKE